MASDKITHTSDSTFQHDVLASDKPVLVDFWATWCGPCRAIAPHLEHLADEFDGKVKIVKLDTDKNPNTPSNYEIKGIPTLLLFKGGKLVGTHVGNAGRQVLKKFIESGLDVSKA